MLSKFWPNFQAATSHFLFFLFFMLNENFNGISKKLLPTKAPIAQLNLLMSH